MRTIIIAAAIGFALASEAHGQNINAPLAHPSPTISTGSPSPVVETPRGPDVGVGGTRYYEQLSGPGGGGIMTPNSNGTSTINNANGTTQVVPTPR